MAASMFEPSGWVATAIAGALLALLIVLKFREKHILSRDRPHHEDQAGNGDPRTNPKKSAGSQVLTGMVVFLVTVGLSKTPGCSGRYRALPPAGPLTVEEYEKAMQTGSLVAVVTDWENKRSAELPVKGPVLRLSDGTYRFLAITLEMDENENIKGAKTKIMEFPFDQVLEAENVQVVNIR